MSNTEPTASTDTALVKKAKQALSRARIAMMGSGSAFITSVCFSLHQVFSDDIPRAGTDGRKIYYNPAWFLSITHEQRIGLVVHETWHVALNHCMLQQFSRLGNRDQKLFNIAADAVINNYIIDAGMQLPPNRVDMPEMRGKSTEQVYEELYQQCQVQAMPEIHPDAVDLLKSSQGDGNAENGNKPAPDDSTEMPMEIKQILVRAAMASRMAGEDPGNLPGDLQFTLEQITNPKLPWDRLVQRYFSASAKTKYSFTKPNRRYMPEFYLPSTNSKTLDHVNMAIDMSGSVSDEQVRQFVTEVAQVLKSIQPKQLSLIEFDTRVSAVTKLTRAHDLVNHEFTGRGGTYINPVFQYSNEHPSDLLVIFTDGYFTQYNLESSVPVLWVIYDNPYFTSELGHVIHVEL